MDVQRPRSPGSGYKFIDLFAGIGGFHEALSVLDAQCVFASEWNEAARSTYRLNYKDSSPEIFEDNERHFNRDITEITQAFDGDKTDTKVKRHIQSKIPQFDVLCAGFPCQPFSQAGHKLGFGDERGNLFFDIEKILYARKPKAIFLENVRHLLKHDNENTIKEIRRRLDEAGYGEVFEFTVKASDHGLPQHRPRVFIIGFRNSRARGRFRQPGGRPLQMTMSDIFGAPVTDLSGKERKIGFTLRVGGKSSPIEDRRNWDGYIVNSEVRRLTPVMGLRMQGFDTEKFRFPSEISYSDQMKQLGNSVAVPAIEDYARAIFEALGPSRRLSNRS